MEPIFLLTLAVIIGFIALGFLIHRQNSNNQILEIIKMLQNSSKHDRETLIRSLQKNTHDLNVRLDNTAQIISSVQKNIGEMSEIGRTMKELQDFIQSPKLRGNIGEQILGQLLKQFLPKGAFFLQYRFKSGETVDAAIKTSAGIVPVDSKFPMNNFRAMISENEVNQKKSYRSMFRKDVKKHIKSISQKYILTDEGTIDYALMYIPSEAVYYEVVNDADLFDYSSKKRVLPVSPTTFYAYLKAILMSFEGQKIERQAKEVLANLRSIKSDYEKMEGELSTLSKHILNANKTFERVYTRFTALGGKIKKANKLKLN